MNRPKKCICIDCGPKMGEVYCIAKRCVNYPYHYVQYRRKENAKKSTNIAKKALKDDFTVFFANQILEPVNHCEECGAPLGEKTRWNIAHILPKSTFPSVSINPQNKFISCKSCHSQFDSSNNEKFIFGMSLLPVLKDRVQKLIPFMTNKEVNKIPSCLL